MRAMILITDDESCHHCAMGSREGQASRPELGRSHSRRVNHKLVTVLVECSRRLDTAYKGAVTQLSLCVGTEDLARPSEWKPLCLLLGGPVVFYGWLK